VSNVYDLPQPLVKALTVERRPVVPGRISVTALIDSPLRRILSMQHGHEIEEDVSENLWSLLGKMGHKTLEINFLVSEIKIEKPFGDATLVGVVDYFNGEVIDFKFTSVWSVIFAADKSEWEQQLQIYGYLVQSLGKPVSGLANWLILRDWNKMERKRSSGDYPEIPFKQISYKPWDKSTCEAFISERVSLHLNAEKIACGQSSVEIPVEYWCTPTERWEKPTKYAVKKQGVEKAVRVFDTNEEAIDRADLEEKRTAKTHYVELRPGENTKCLNYCSVNTWCPFYKTLEVK